MVRAPATPRQGTRSGISAFSPRKAGSAALYFDYLSPCCSDGKDTHCRAREPFSFVGSNSLSETIGIRVTGTRWLILPEAGFSNTAAIVVSLRSRAETDRDNLAEPFVPRDLDSLMGSAPDRTKDDFDRIFLAAPLIAHRHQIVAHGIQAEVQRRARGLATANLANDYFVAKVMPDAKRKQRSPS